MKTGWYRPRKALKAHYFQGRKSRCKKHLIPRLGWWLRVRWGLLLSAEADVDRGWKPCRACLGVSNRNLTETEIQYGRTLVPAPDPAQNEAEAQEAVLGNAYEQGKEAGRRRESALANIYLMGSDTGEQWEAGRQIGLKADAYKRDL